MATDNIRTGSPMRVLRGVHEGATGPIVRRCERTGWVWIRLDAYKNVPKYASMEFGPYVPGVDVAPARQRTAKP